MAKIHALKLQPSGGCSIVIHVNMPGGNNSAGKPWKDCYLSDLEPTSILKVGTAPGNISQAEYDSIEAGDIIELRRVIQIESGGATLSSIQELVDKIVVEELEILQRKYKHYGKEIT